MNTPDDELMWEKLEAEIEKRLREIAQLEGTQKIICPGKFAEKTRNSTEQQLLFEGEEEPSPTILKGYDIAKQAANILIEHQRPMTRGELWEEFQKMGFYCGGRSPRDTFAASLYDSRREEKSLLIRIQENPVKYWVKTQPLPIH